MKPSRALYTIVGALICAGATVEAATLVFAVPSLIAAIVLDYNEL